MSTRSKHLIGLKPRTRELTAHACGRIVPTEDLVVCLAILETASCAARNHASATALSTYERTNDGVISARRQEAGGQETR